MRCGDSPWSGTRSAANRGYTLLELVVVTTILAVLAAVALPGFNPSQDEKLYLAAVRVAEALRYARTEAIRSGEPHGVEVFSNTDQVVASKANMIPATPVPLLTLIDPVSKQPLDLNLAQDGTTAGVDVVGQPFSYGAGDFGIVLFDAQGMPFWKSGGTFYQLDDGLVQLGLAGQQRSVRVAPVTGRVTIE